MRLPVTTASICAPSEDVVSRDIDGDIIIVPLVAGIGETDDELYTLNPTGQAIWQKLDGQRTLGEIAEDLSREFSSPAEEITADVLGFATEMASRGILAVKG